MAGKASLLLVMGFSMIFLVFGQHFNSMSTNAVDNFTDYYAQNMAHNLASSGANLAANAFFLDNNWRAGYSNLNVDGGTLNVKFVPDDYDTTNRKILSIAEYEGIIDTVALIYTPIRFSYYAYDSDSEGVNIRWTDKDTVFGPFHTQDYLLCDNHPVFGVTGYPTSTSKKLVYADFYDKYGYSDPTKYTQSYFDQSKANDKPSFLGSFTIKDDPIPLNGLQPLRDAAEDNGLKLQPTTTVTTTTVWVPPTRQRINGKYVNVPGHYEQVITTSVHDTAYVNFSGDSVKIKMGYDQPETTSLTSDIAPNGVIYAEGMDVRLQGTVEGQYSVVSDGNIYLDDDVKYKNDPKTNPNSTDILGILAQKNILISDDKHGNYPVKNIEIDAAMYAEKGGFGAENYSSRSIDGSINLYGGITQKIRQAVGTYSGTTQKTGYMKRYHYDPRLMKIFPPFFPVSTAGYRIVSWKE